MLCRRIFKFIQRQYYSMCAESMDLMPAPIAKNEASHAISFSRGQQGEPELDQPAYTNVRMYSFENDDDDFQLTPKIISNSGVTETNIETISKHEEEVNQVELNLTALWKDNIPKDIVKVDTMMNANCRNKKFVYKPRNITYREDIRLPICRKSQRNLVRKLSRRHTTAPPMSLSLDDVYPMVQRGGHYKPKDCYSKDKVAVLVPYRNREENLAKFLLNIHPFLMEQNIEYQIFLVEQYGNSIFNKGRLLNAGFREIRRYGWWRCVVFHDVDLLPMSSRILYSCPPLPRHMSSMVHERGSKRNTSSPILFGGVTSMLMEHYERANGHSNRYWGWGGEDYDMFWRLRAVGLKVMRYNRSIGQYFALSHVRGKPNPLRYRLLKSAVSWQPCDGLNSLRYRLISVKLKYLYTQILVDINQPSDPVENNMLSLFKPSIQGKEKT